jgi:hypothetical protein
MDPVQGFTMLSFLNWLVARHPEVESLEGMPEVELLDLAAEFQNRQYLDGERAEKWKIGFSTLLQGDSRWKGYSEARAAARELGSLSQSKRSQKGHLRTGPDDPIRRYRRIPLHAMFLYSSEDREFASYVSANWHALDGMSGNFCDLHPSLDQLRGAEDAYNALDLVPEIIGGTGRVRLSELPGIMFWDQRGRAEYVSFSNMNSHDQIRSGLRQIFEGIRASPGILSIQPILRGVQ